MDQSRTLKHVRLHHTNHTTTNATKKDLKKERHSIPSFRHVVDKEVTLLRNLNLTTAPTLSSFLKATRQERRRFSFRLIQSLPERNGGGTHHSSTKNAFVYHYRKSFAYPLSRGMYAQQLYFWLHPDHGGIGPYRPDHDLHIISYEAFSQNRRAVLQTVLHDVLGLPQSDIASQLRRTQLEKDYSPGRYGNPALKRRRWRRPDLSSNTTTTNRTRLVQEVMLGLIDDDDDGLYNDIHASITDEELLSLKLDGLLHEYLQRFYQPYQIELVTLLGRRTEWHQHKWE
jgi:hypothetical protein